METGPQNSEDNMGTVRKSGGGFVREGGEHSLPAVLLSVTPPLGGDALTMPWPNARLYAFPPLKILSQVLHKIREEKALSVINHSVLAEQTLVPDLLEILTAPPWPIPLRLVSTVSGGRLGMAPQF